MTSKREEPSQYADAIVQTIRHPLLILDGELRARSANAAFYQTFRVSEQDTAGRLVNELGNRQWDIPRLRELLEDVLPKKQEIVDFEVEHEFEQIGRRTMLLNARAVTREGRPDRILLAIEDITERKQQQNELIARREFSEKIVDAVREPLLILNWDLQVQSANESFYQKFQVKLEETEGRFVYELGNGEWDIPKLRELLENVLPQNNTFDGYEVEHEFPDLGRRIMLLNARRIDHIKLILLAIEDITERRAAERRKQFIIDLNDAIGNLEEPRAVLEVVTRSLAEYLRISRVSYAEVAETGQTLNVLYRYRKDHGTDVHSYALEQFSPGMMAELRSGRTLVVSDVHRDERTRQRTEVFQAADAQAVLCAPIIYEGQLHGFLALAHHHRRSWSDEETTLAEQLALRTWSTVERLRAQARLRESEERYRTLFNSIDEGFCVIEVLFDAAGKPVDYRFLETNPAFERQTGLKDAVGKRMRQLAPDHEEHWFQTYGQIALTGRPQRFVAEARQLDHRWYDVYAFRVGPPEARRIAALFNDVSDRKRAEQVRRATEERIRDLNATLEQRIEERTALAERRAEQLRALAAELTRTEQRERRHLAGILHDHLQQQLIAAKMHAGIAQEDLTHDEPKRLLQQVLDLLDESIQTARSLSVELSPPVLHERGLAAGLEWLAGQMQKQHGLAVHVETEPGADPSSEELRELLFHAVRELLLNVVKHAGTSEAQLRMTRHADQVRLDVIDQGKGFEPSEQEASTTFGLFQIRERLGPIGGQMTIDSAPGRGAHTTIMVPCGPETKPAAPEPQPLPPEAGTRKIRILLVDDHRIIREGMIVLLEREPDLRVIGEAGDGQTAVSITRDLEPDVVLMDVSMPRMSGIEATHQIRATMPDVRVIGLSLHGEDAMRQAMIGAGAAAYLTKGGPAHELIETIREVASPASPPARAPAAEVPQ